MDSDKPSMNIISAIRTLRQVRNIPYQEARDLAIKHFLKNGLPVPESILRLHERFD